MIFVFGSNLAGIHGAGAAHTALRFHGAKMGVSTGRTNNAYAIPTKDAQIKKTLTLRAISGYVEGFIQYARQNPELTFQVTCIGCGLAGLNHEEIAPMFMHAPKNCQFDLNWKEYLGDERTYWGSY